MLDVGGRSMVACGNGTDVKPEAVLESAPMDSQLARLQLRQRWELASILNFLNVFEPVLGMKVKISAEEIEMALIEPDESLSQLHVALLKGIPPVSKLLNTSYGWVTVLSKKVKIWWPWVAEGDCPLSPAKGEEINTYKTASPIIRLLLLKALCEIRADQDDILSHINDSIKNGTALSAFRKDKLGGDGCGISYWYDGNETIGHRLYKEIVKVECMPKVRGVGNTLAMNSQWETLATNLEEFRAFADNVSCSEAKWEEAVGKAVQADIIPVLEKIQKKKDKVLQRNRRQEVIPNGFGQLAFTRSCRNRGPVNYRFDDYDKAIKEAIEVTNNKKTTKVKGFRKQYSEQGTINGTAPEKTLASCSTENESTKSELSDTQSDHEQGSDYADSTSDENDGEKTVDSREEDSVNTQSKGDIMADDSDNSTLLEDPHCKRSSENKGDTAECEVVADSESEE
ncbi:unnamed protein product [Cuscuta epithymum]|uniref:DDT domain-containing protein DDR4 n=1 Tax=Cuscuta epithymum TaxID=186058 RepID=A0AAV0EDT9_9ASTE|nr:unnamed protein product [Cuscuta epithymum]